MLAGSVRVANDCAVPFLSATEIEVVVTAIGYLPFKECTEG
jgi:hypothetical protein